MAILWGFESLPDAVSRFCSDFLEFGTNPAIFKDLSYGCKGSGNTSCLGCQKLSKSLTQQPSQDLWSNASLDVFGPTSAACGSLLLVLESLVSCRGEQGIWSNAHVLLADTMALMRHLLKVICLPLCFEASQVW